MEEKEFSLLGFWHRRTTFSTCAVTEAAEVARPHLVPNARLFHGVEPTSCNVERSFSAISNLPSALRSSMLLDKAGRMMFRRLNRLFLAEARALHDDIEDKAAAAAKIGSACFVFSFCPKCIVQFNHLR